MRHSCHYFKADINPKLKKLEGRENEGRLETMTKKLSEIESVGGEQSSLQTVKDLMTAKVIAVTTVTFLPEAAKIMREEDIGVLPVTEPDGRLLGVLTDRDITVRAVAEGKDISATQVADVFSAGDVITATPDTALAEAEQLMAEHKVRRLPVINPDRQLVGILSLADIAQALSEQDTGELLKEVTMPGGEHSQVLED